MVTMLSTICKEAKTSRTSRKGITRPTEPLEEVSPRAREEVPSKDKVEEVKERELVREKKSKYPQAIEDASGERIASIC